MVRRELAAAITGGGRKAAATETGTAIAPAPNKPPPAGTKTGIAESCLLPILGVIEYAKVKKPSNCQ